MPARRGFSLLETMFSLILLTLVFVGVFTLFESSLRYAARAERRALSTQLALNQLADLRNWARQPTGAGSNYDQLSSYPSGPTAPDPEHGDITVEVKVLDLKVDTPSTSFESAFPAADRRQIKASLKQVEILVRAGSDEFKLESFVGETPRRLRATNPVVVLPVSSIPSRVAKGAGVDFRVECYDEFDRLIPDLLCSWSVRPINGVGLIDPQARDGSKATFVNRSRRLDGTTFYTGGSCRVAARARYGGDEQVGQSDILVLEGP